MTSGMQRVLPSLLLTALLCSPAAFAQTGTAPHWPAPELKSTEVETAFAKALAAMPEAEAAAAVEKAPAADITPGLALALRALVIADSNARHFREARADLRIGLAVATRLDIPMVRASFLMNLGRVLRTLGDNEASLAYYDEAIAAYRAADAGPLDLGRALDGRVDARRDTGDLEGAIEDGTRALQLEQQAGDTESYARTLNNLGNVETMHGDYAQALEHYEWGLRLAREKKQRLGEAFLLNNIANLYLIQNNPQQASEYCLQSIRIKESLNNLDDLATSLVNLALIYRSAKRYNEASQTAQRAYEVATHAGRPIPLISSLELRAKLAEDHQQHAEAEAALRQALATERSAGLSAQEMSTLAYLARVEFLEGRTADAERDASVALSAARERQRLDVIVDAALVKARTEEQQNQHAQARESLLETIAATESLREHVAGDESAQRTFFADNASPYQDLVALDVREGRLEEALHVAEQEKGRSLLDLLTRGHVSISESLQPGERAEERKLLAALSSLEARDTAARNGTQDAAALAGLGAQLQHARVALRSFYDRMYVQHPELARHRGVVPVVSLEHTAALMGSPATALLEFEVTPDATYLFVVSQVAGKPVLHAHAIDVKSTRLESMIGSFHTALEHRSTDFDAASVALYRLLLAPARADLQGKRTLIIVPSGPLWRLPFQALQAAPGRYLLQNAAVAYEPSLSVLRADLENAKKSPTANTLLALADSAKDLPEADQEVSGLVSIYGPQNSRTFTGATATVDNFRSNAARYRVLHFATHGVLDDTDPMYSHLLLSSGTAGGGKLVRLNAEQIARANLPASLVVLSGCATGDGKLQQGEGLVGLGYSFLAAGAHTVVASQWRVDSASTTQLMIAFHRKLHEGMSKAQALRAAELELARSPSYRHPFYWAGFVLLGQN